MANLKHWYINVIGDGDSKAFNAVKETKPYAEEVLAEKQEGINHVGKRFKFFSWHK